MAADIISLLKGRRFTHGGKWGFSVGVVLATAGHYGLGSVAHLLLLLDLAGY